MITALTILLLTPALPAPGSISGLEEIRRELTRRLSADELSKLTIPFEADDEISELAATVTRGAHGNRQKLSRLLAYFRGKGYLNRYQKTGTSTAREPTTSARW